MKSIIQMNIYSSYFYDRQNYMEIYFKHIFVSSFAKVHNWLKYNCD
jgi:hypothetical protein